LLEYVIAAYCKRVFKLTAVNALVEICKKAINLFFTILITTIAHHVRGSIYSSGKVWNDVRTRQTDLKHISLEVPAIMQLLNSKRGVLELIIGRRRVKARVTRESKIKVKKFQHFNPPFHNVVTIPIRCIHRQGASNQTCISVG